MSSQEKPEESSLISIIIPYHVVNQLLYRAINSVLEQSWRPLELILVSDGCADQINSKEFSGSGVNVHLKYIKVNSGPATARNYGIQSATGNFIAFLDSDDYWMPQKLEKQMSVLNAQPRTENVVVISAVKVVADGRILYQRFPIMEKAGSQIEQILKGPFMYLGSTALFNAELGRRVGGQTRELRIYEDFEWQIRMAFKHDVSFVCTNSADVCVERSKRTHSAHNLKKNHQELIASLKEIPNLPKKALDYMKVIYLIDRAASEFHQRHFGRFLYFLSCSFVRMPRMTLLLDKFWNDSDSGSKTDSH